MNLFFLDWNNNNMKKYLLLIILLFSFRLHINAEEKINYLESLNIEGYDINFKKSIYEYDITIDNEDYLNINYELSDDNAYVNIRGNGNFNKSHNVIYINVNNNYEYKINVYKSLQVSYIEEDDEIEQMSNTEKNTLKLSIITIVSMIVVYFSYLMFYKN